MTCYRMKSVYSEMQGMHSNHGNELEDFDNAGFIYFFWL